MSGKLRSAGHEKRTESLLSLSLDDSDKIDPDTSQTAWFIDRLNGRKSGAGTADDPVDSAATIAARWSGSSGQRPKLPNGTKLVLQGSATHIYSGTLATVSSFSRTSANGQIKITDDGISNYGPLAASIFVDSTAGAVAWLYEPKLLGSTGIISSGRVPIVGGSVGVPPAMVTINIGDSYDLASLTPVYFGTDSLTFGGYSASVTTITITWLNGASVQPDVSDPLSVLLNVDGVSNIVIYRLHGAAVVGGLTFPGPADVWRPQCSSDVASSSGTFIILQECRIDQKHVFTNGNILMFNCATTFGTLPCGFVEGLGNLVRHSGFSYSGIEPNSGGHLTLDGDFLIDGNGSLLAIDGAVIFIGNFSRWGTSRNAIVIELSIIHIQNLFDSSHVVYGTVGAGNIVIQFAAHSQGAAVQYDSGQSAVATFQFDSTGPHWQFPSPMGTNGFGLNVATGVWVGPTTNTWEHLDAALAAGIGFGGQSVDPTTGNSIRSFLFT
jgi:hypothetical protein